MPTYENFSWHPWVETAITAVVALVISWVLYRVLRVAMQRLVRPYETPQLVLKHAERPIGFILPLLALQIVWDSAPAELHKIELVRHLSSLALIAAITWLGIAGIRGMFEAVIVLHPVDVDDNLHAR